MPPRAPSRALSAVVAICPAPEEILLRGLRSGEIRRFECDLPATELWLESIDIYDAAVARSGRRPRCSCCTPAATSRSPTR